MCIYRHSKRDHRSIGAKNMDNAVAAVAVTSVRDIPPSHYALKLSSFSLFRDAKNIDTYESEIFEADGYKWKLSVHPSGNKKNNVNGHISLYLAIANPETLPRGWEVHVDYKLFVFDQIRDKYLTIRDDAEGGIRRFHRMKTEWGFDEFLSLDTLNDASKGYLVDDCCVFGAEVFVIKHASKGESTSLVKDPVNNIYTWRIDKFLDICQDFLYSQEFVVQQQKWKLCIYPKGNSSAKGKSLSLYLHLADSKTLCFDRKVYVMCKLRIKDRFHGNHLEKEVDHWFCASSASLGYPKFMDLSDLNDASKGFMVNGVVTVEAQITLISSTKDF